jgi:hypothetical protein
MKARSYVGALRLALLLIPALLCGAVAPAAGAAEPASAWQVISAAQPTYFVPGSSASDTEYPQYSFLIYNVGGATAEGVVITDVLPAGISPGPEPGNSRVPSSFRAEAAREACSASGQTVTCTVKPNIVPGDFIEVKIPITVSSSAPSSVTNELTVESTNAAVASSRQLTPVTAALAPFDFGSGEGLYGAVFDEAGDPPLAGAHPYMTSFSLAVPTIEVPGVAEAQPAEALRSAGFELPQGLVVDPQASKARCPFKKLNSGARTPRQRCSLESQVGEAVIYLAGLAELRVPLYNMVPPPGAAAELGFELESTPITVLGGVSGGFHLTAHSSEILSRFPLPKVTINLWGVPSDSRHDNQREGEGCSNQEPGYAGCSIEPSPAAFVTMPTSCGESPTLTATIRGWLGNEASRTQRLASSGNQPFDVNGCNSLEFNPTIASKATTNVADSPSGLDFNLHQPQNQQLDGLATAALKDTTVTLPAGMNLNPAVAGGLAACSEAQMGYAPEEGKTRFATTHQTCPDASKLGTVEISTPLLDHKLPGAVYLAKPYENPFGNLTAIYLAIEDEEAGVIAKLAGKATPDPVTGQLSATFTENPELPVEDIDLHFFNGARAAFTTPLTCGTKTTTSVLTPWSTPEGADAVRTDSFQTEVPAGGSGNCPTSEANAPNKPSFTAGTLAPEAGAYSPFVLKLTRPDGTQRLTAIDTTLPKGLAAKFAGIPYCSEAQIAQAQARSNPNQGALEQASPSCPAASEVGIATVGAGSGPTPTYVQGHAYLAGPYKGAPLSLAIITPAIAGPFDLGAVVVRTAIYINPETAQGHAVSDPLPSIIQGVPLDIRSVAIKLDRPGGFTLNPTSCDPMAITGSAAMLTGQSAALTSPFQVGGCSALKFKPNLKISLKGGTKRHSFPALKAVLTYPKGQNANIASAQVTLPHSAFLEQGHIGTVCTRVQFAADACPKASIYGKAKAITPLLDQPLEGPVYLRSSSHELPDLVAALHGQIDVDLVGRVDTGKGGGIRNTFEAAPDAPVSKFVLEMKGGSKGLLVNSEDICRKPQRASVSFTGQNGKAFDATPLIKNSCGGKAKKKSSKKGHGHKH